MSDIAAGDIVRHGPTGEEWYVLGVQRESDRLCPAGWPHSIGKLSDCTLTKRGKGITDAERASRGKMFPGYAWDKEEHDAGV